MQEREVPVSQGDVVILKSLWEITVHLGDHRPESRVEFTQATCGRVNVAECGGR